MFFCSGLIVPLDAWKGFMGEREILDHARCLSPLWY